MNYRKLLLAKLMSCSLVDWSNIDEVNNRILMFENKGFASYIDDKITVMTEMQLRELMEGKTIEIIITYDSAIRFGLLNHQQENGKYNDKKIGLKDGIHRRAINTILSKYGLKVVDRNLNSNDKIYGLLIEDIIN